jgi:transcriptional regulator with XRE-family HTH domain
MIILRIQELIAGKNNQISLEQLSKLSNVSVEEIQSYSNIENPTDEIATKLRKIAKQLNISVVELVEPVNKQQAFKLKISEIAKSKGLTLKELSDISGIHPAFIEFYSTQAIREQTLVESLCQTHLNQICEILGYNLVDLQVPAELAVTKLRLEEIVRERGITLEKLSLLMGLPHEFLEFVVNQPVNISELSCEFCCQLLGQNNCGKCNCNQLNNIV